MVSINVASTSTMSFVPNPPQANFAQQQHSRPLSVNQKQYQNTSQMIHLSFRTTMVVVVATLAVEDVMVEKDVKIFSVTSVRSLVMMLPTAGTGPQLPMLCSLSYVGTISHHASALFQFLWSCSAISLLSVYAGSCSSTNASSHYFCSTDYASANADYAATTPSSYLGSSSSNYTASVNSTNVYIQSYGLLQSSGHDYWFHSWLIQQLVS